MGDVAPGEDADEIVDARILNRPPDLLFHRLGRASDGPQIREVDPQDHPVDESSRPPVEANPHTPRQ